MLKTINKINTTERSRLKMTILGVILIFLLTCFPMYIILDASKKSIFEIAAAWTAYGIGVTTIGAIIGYYVNKESLRPSIFGGIMDFASPVYKELPGEDESDPDEIPL